VIAQVRTLIIVDVVHVADVVLLATRLVWTLIKEMVWEYIMKYLSNAVWKNLLCLCTWNSAKICH
jgi:hypothetical protein